mmetsp:Transcript_58005/g.147138  ORF Transcript_58005/g.147138 Transcript_58005/m.147138 type:complete len:364 (-) Transcript_58005:11-1102(-)
MLDLQPRVKLQEVELLALRIEEVLDSAGPHVADVLGQALGCSLHFQEGITGHNRRRSLLEDLLEAALRGAVAPDQGDNLSVFITNKLYLQVSSSSAELHHEDGRPGNLGRDLLPASFELFIISALPDALASTTLRGFQDDRVADTSCTLPRLLTTLQACPLEGLFWDAAVGLDVSRHTLSIPRYARDLRRLCQNCRRDLVTQGMHYRCCWAKEHDTCFCKSARQSRVFTRMAPAWPNAIYLLLLRSLNDEFNVLVIVGVLPGRDLHKSICKPDELSVCLKVVLARHGDELERLSIAKFQKSPLAHGHNGLGRSHAIVCDEDPPEDTLAATALDVLLQALRSHCRCASVERRFSEGGRMGRRRL